MPAQMSFEDFLQSTEAEVPPARLTHLPPADLSRALQALWLEARGDWAGAHTLAQETDSREGDWVHAYLHRKEGDLANAAYWYRRAGRPPATGEPRSEWEAMARVLLGR